MNSQQVTAGVVVIMTMIVAIVLTAVVTL